MASLRPRSHPARACVRLERGAPLVLLQVRQPEARPEAFDAHGDAPDAGPGVEPAVQEPQLGLGGRELEETEGGAEVSAARVVAAHSMI